MNVLIATVAYVRSTTYVRTYILLKYGVIDIRPVDKSLVRTISIRSDVDVSAKSFSSTSCDVIAQIVYMMGRLRSFTDYSDAAPIKHSGSAEFLQLTASDVMKTT